MTCRVIHMDTWKVLYSACLVSRVTPLLSRANQARHDPGVMLQGKPIFFPMAFVFLGVCIRSLDTSSTLVHNTALIVDYIQGVGYCGRDGKKRSCITSMWGEGLRCHIQNEIAVYCNNTKN